MKTASLATKHPQRAPPVCRAVTLTPGFRAALTPLGPEQRIRKVQPEGYLRLRVDGGGCSVCSNPQTPNLYS